MKRTVTVVVMVLAVAGVSGCGSDAVSAPAASAGGSTLPVATMSAAPSAVPTAVVTKAPRRKVAPLPAAWDGTAVPQAFAIRACEQIGSEAAFEQVTFPGTAASMAPADPVAVIRCTSFHAEPQDGLHDGSQAHIVEDAGSARELAGRLNALPPIERQGCSLVGGGDYSLVFVEADGDAQRVRLDANNCRSVENEALWARGSDELTEHIGTTMTNRAARVVRIALPDSVER